MRKKITILSAALMLLAFLAVPLGMRGQTGVSWTASEQGYANAADVTDITIDDNIAGTFAKASGTNAPKYYTTGEAVRMYNNNTLTITPGSDCEITEIAFTFSQSGGFTVSDGEYSVENLSGTWTGSSTEPIVFTNGSAQNRIKVITVTYTSGGTPAVTHTLTFSADPTNGGTVSVNNNTTGSIDLAEGATASISATANAGYVFGSWTVGGEGSSVNNAGDTFTMGTENATLTANFTAVTTYTVTYYPNITGISPIEVVYNAGEDVTVAENTFSNPGFDFSEWNTQADGDGDPYEAGDEIENIQSNLELYAIWIENTSPTPGGSITATLNIESYAAANSWVNGTKYTTANVDDVTFTANGGNNTGKYYTSGQEWRYYQGENATITISVPDGYHLVSITPTYNPNNGGVLLNGSATIQSGSTVDVSGTSVTFSLGNSGSATNGQVRFTNIDVIYESEGGSQSQSDLTITNTSTDLTFDLYNNADPQVINYTTSSTGAITITPETSTYLSYVHDADNKTITITPLAVTPSTQTITISQAADDNYYAGTATFTVFVANSDPDTPGTVNNPYTVAEAREFIDGLNGQTSADGIHVMGIISQIDSYNSNYHSITYWISDDGTTTSDQLEVYSGKGLDGADFTSIDDIEVGAEVVVKGKLKMYGETYEFDYNNQLVTYTAPTHLVEAPTFNPAAGVYEEAQNVTITCTTEGVTIYYTIDGTEPTNESNVFDQVLNIAGTTTIKAIAIKDSDVSNVATATYHIANSESNPYSVYEALNFHEYPTPGIYVHGIVSTAPTQDPTNNGELTYFISFDGEATDQLEVYKGKGLDQAVFTSQDDIQVGDIVTIYGTVQIYNNIIEFASGNYLVSFERPASTEPSVTVTPNTIEAPVDGAEGTLALAYENITDFISFDFSFCDANGGELEEDPDWIYAEIQEGDETYSLYYLIDDNDSDPRTAYIKVYTFDDDLEEVYAIVTISQDGYVAPAPDYAELPFSFDGGRADIENTAGLTQSGLGSDYGSSPKLKFDTQDDYLVLKINETPGVLLFSIKGTGNPWEGTFDVQTSVDGETYTSVATYTDNLGDTETKTIDNLAADVRYIRWYFTAKTSGCNVGIGNIALAQYVAIPSITVDPTELTVNADEHDGTLALTYANLEISDMSDFEIQYYDAQGEETDEPDWIEVLVAEQDPEIGEGYVVSYYMVENEGEEGRAAYFKVYAMDDETNLVYSNLVTINQTGVASITLPTTLEIEAGDYIIVNELPIAYANVEVENYQSFTIQFYDNNNTVLEENPDWVIIGVVGDNEDGYKVAGYVTANTGEARAAYFKVSAQDVSDYTVYSNLVTITQAAGGAPVDYAILPFYWLGGTKEELLAVQGVTANGLGSDYAAVNAPYRVKFDGTGDYIQVKTDTKPDFVIVDVKMLGGSNTSYITVQASVDGETFDEGEALTISGAQNDILELTSTRSFDESVRYIRLYFTKGSNVGVGPITIGKYESYPLAVTGYGDNEGGYVLLASPVTVDPANTGMITDDGTDEENLTYDFYYFDQTQDLEWVNYREQSFNLVPGKGYLYANKNDVDLTFTGTPYSGNGQITLTKTENADFAGWNLIGNPFGNAATIDKAYYRLNEDGSEVDATTEQSAIVVMEGVFVVAETNGETVTFTEQTNPVNNDQVSLFSINVSMNYGATIDRAIVRFDNGNQLPKFQLNPNHTKVYIPQGENDYAIVRSANEGEMPVSFKAENNGTYTFSVNADNVEMEYLHLIDNMTGADVDLLAMPSYSFEARTTDYANRFRLVFSANDENGASTDSETFAFFNGSEWCISNMGAATLQVIDVTGRILSSENVNGNATISLNETPGVYVFRLVNGDNVKTQKIVVK